MSDGRCFRWSGAIRREKAEDVKAWSDERFTVNCRKRLAGEAGVALPCRENVRYAAVVNYRITVCSHRRWHGRQRRANAFTPSRVRVLIWVCGM